MTPEKGAVLLGQAYLQNESVKSSAEFWSTLGTVGLGWLTCDGADRKAVLLRLLRRGIGKPKNILSHHVQKQVCLKDAEC